MDMEKPILVWGTPIYIMPEQSKKTHAREVQHVRDEDGGRRRHRRRREEKNFYSVVFPGRCATISWNRSRGGPKKLILGGERIHSVVFSGRRVINS